MCSDTSVLKNILNYYFKDRKLFEDDSMLSNHSFIASPYFVLLIHLFKYNPCFVSCLFCRCEHVKVLLSKSNSEISFTDRHKYLKILSVIFIEEEKNVIEKRNII